MKMGMGRRYTRAFQCCYFSSERPRTSTSFYHFKRIYPELNLQSSSQASHSSIYYQSLALFVFRKYNTHTIMECKANQLAQLASWLQCASVQHRKSTLHPAAVGRKLPLSARKYQVALMGKTPHVGIIGAGVSGLRCADILAQNGAKVTILEARNRIGGRVRSSSPHS